MTFLKPDEVFKKRCRLLFKRSITFFCCATGKFRKRFCNFATSIIQENNI